LVSTSVDTFEVVDGLGPVEPAAGRRKYRAGFIDPTGQVLMVEAVDGGLFAIRHHDLIAKGVHGPPSKEPAGGLRDDPDACIQVL
jgi:hypothetical protein